MAEQTTYQLSIDESVLERCFLTADILAETYGHPKTEYGMIGMARQSEPFRIIAAPLLPGQQVSPSQVYQRGHHVMAMRQETEALALQMGEPLVPISFIHRHPGPCGMSETDEKFLTGVLIDQVSTVITLNENRPVLPGEFPCGCMADCAPQSTDERAGKPVVIEYGLCFSIIVNRERELSIDAARKQWCPACNQSAVRIVPAALQVDEHEVPDSARRQIRSQLSLEIAAKILFVTPKDHVSHDQCE